MKARITKIKSLLEGPHPNGIEVGYVKEGIVSTITPRVGESFYIGFNFRTSEVTKIIDKDTFETLNAVYKVELISP